MNTIQVLALIIFMMILSSLCYCQTKNQKPLLFDHNTITTSHRGYAGNYPENTLIGIQKAVDLKVDRIEIDVQQTKDSVIILMHDKTINRTTNGNGRIKDLTYNKLKQFSAGIKFNTKFKNQGIPTLQEVLNIIDGQSTLVIEIKYGKNYYPGIEQNIVNIIQEAQASRWCIIQSFQDNILKEIHKLDSSIVLHKLLLTTLFYDLDKLSFIKEYSVYHNAISKDLIRKVHKKNKRINAWTVNDERKIKKLINWQIDGIITDRPNIVLKIKEQIKKAKYSE